METRKPASVDEYIAGYPADVQAILQRIRETIQKAAPGAEEKISYAMPAFTLNGRNLVYFAAFQNHIGFYPSPEVIVRFKKDLSAFRVSKGAIQFPYNIPMPLDLISRMIKFRVRENIERAVRR